MVSKGFPNVTASGQQYNIGEKPSVILYTYINLHAGTPKPLFTLKTVPISTQYLLNIRTGLTDANAFRGHRLTTQKGTYYEKQKRNKRTQKSQHTHAIVGKKKEKNKTPDSQTSQATCQTKEIDKAHRSHSTRDAKQNKTSKKNQGSPIKTIKSMILSLYPYVLLISISLCYDVGLPTLAIGTLYTATLAWIFSAPVFPSSRRRPCPAGLSQLPQFSLTQPSRT